MPVQKCVMLTLHQKRNHCRAYWVLGKLVGDDYPLAMPVEMLAKELNLPTLQDSVNDIMNNYLNRPASKKWILCDYPEKKLKAQKEAGKALTLSIPSALGSFLPKPIRETIGKEREKRFPKAKIKIT